MKTKLQKLNELGFIGAMKEKYTMVGSYEIGYNGITYEVVADKIEWQANVLEFFREDITVAFFVRWDYWIKII